MTENFTDRNLPAVLRRMRSDIDLIRRELIRRPSRPSPESDTGWVDLSSYAAAGSNVQGRRVGSVVQIRSFAMSQDLPTGSGVTAVLTAIPVEFRPSSNSWGTGYTTNGFAIPFLIRGAGTGAVGNATGSTITANWQFSVTYLAG